MRRRAVVVGAGVGGLTAAIRLAAGGMDVTVVERSTTVGGKLASHRADGFTWETGPSLLTLPQVFDDVLRVAGSSLDAELDLVQLDPAVRHHFADGATFDARADPAATRASVVAMSPDSGPSWDRWSRRAAAIWTTAERTFLAGPMEDPRRLLTRPGALRDLVAIDPLPTLLGRARRTFSDPRLVQWACRYATYAGSDAGRVPATLACITHVEQRYGCWAVRGGLDQLAQALARAATGVGCRITTGTEVADVRTDGLSATGVRLASGEELRSDVVVVNADAWHLYHDLLPHPPSLRRVEAAGRSTSGFVLLLGLRGTTPARAHHNVFFCHDAQAERLDLRSGVAPRDPTVYVCNASVTDPAAAPAGHESWFVLVNAPALGAAATWAPGRAQRYGDDVIAALDRRGLDVARRIVHREAITPADLEERHRAPGGAIYGSSSNGRRAAFLRPANRGPLRGLYLVGGSTHPGGGLPLVAMSGRLVSDMVREDG